MVDGYVFCHAAVEVQPLDASGRGELRVSGENVGAVGVGVLNGGEDAAVAGCPVLDVGADGLDHSSDFVAECDLWEDGFVAGMVQVGVEVGPADSAMTTLSRTCPGPYSGVGTSSMRAARGCFSNLRSAFMERM